MSARQVPAAGSQAAAANPPAAANPAAASPDRRRGGQPGAPSGGQSGGQPPSARRHRRLVPTLISLLVGLAGVTSLLSVFASHFNGRVRTLASALPLTVTHAADAATVMSGLLLLALAKALRRRKRRAWRAAVVVVAVSVGLHLAKGFLPGEAVLSLLVLLALLVYRDEFRAQGDPRTRWGAVYTGVGMAAVSIVVGLSLLAADHSGVAGHPGFLAQAEQVLEGFVGITGPVHFRSDRLSDLSYDVFTGLGVVTILTTAYLALRPAEPRAMLAPDDELRMRALLARHGCRDSLGYFALRRDKSVVWSPSAKACVSYRVVSGVMLASGDPLGDPEAWPGAMTRFLDTAAEHAWVPAVMGCSEEAGIAWARFGLTALELGDEAIVEVADFTLEGRAMRNVRQAVGRVERAGYQAQIRRSRDISAAERDQLSRQAAAWRGAETERGFSMALGRFGDPADGDCVWVTATLDGRLRAFLHFVPWGHDGWSLELMRRDREADNGLNEFLIVAALRAAPELGICRLSLNFAVFRSALERGERLGAGPVTRAWRWVLVFSSRWFQIETLYRFNAKFRPVWEPRFVCYPTAADLPRVGFAALEAEAFLVWPTAWRHALARLRAAPAARLGRRAAEPTEPG